MYIFTLHFNTSQLHFFGLRKKLYVHRVIQIKEYTSIRLIVAVTKHYYCSGKLNSLNPNKHKGANQTSDWLQSWDCCPPIGVSGVKIRSWTLVGGHWCGQFSISRNTHIAAL